MKDTILSRNVILHLRLPFSLFLMPVYFFAISQSSNIDIHNAVLVFLALHFFIYPASNIYNSYMDRDEGPIGGLAKPPLVQESFFMISILLDIVGLLLLVAADRNLLIPGLLYSAVSRAYSWDKIRIKKYAVAGWLTVAIFQGGYTYFLVNSACSGIYSFQWITPATLTAALLATLLIGGYYPFTQIYQHDEDEKRGDNTISLLLGIKGTFIFCGVIFLLALGIGYSYFIANDFLVFVISLIPVLVYYFYWFRLVIRDDKYANYRHTMRMTALSSICMCICWLTILYLHNV